MILGIAAELSAPPSSPSCFRDVTLWSKIRGYDVVAISPPSMLDPYHRWFKKYGLWDYLDDLLPPGQIRTFTIEIEGGVNARLTAHNLHAVLSVIV